MYTVTNEVVEFIFAPTNNAQTMYFCNAYIVVPIVSSLLLLTLGAHAQRGLQYSVCLSHTHCVTVCICNTPGLSSGLNAEISTSTKCKRYFRVF